MPLSCFLTLAWIIACTNAVNLIDGVDGLAAGIGLVATVTTLIAALLHHNIELPLPLCRWLEPCWAFCVSTSTPHRSISATAAA